MPNIERTNGETVRVLVDAIHTAPGGGLTYAIRELHALEQIPGIELSIWTNRRVSKELGNSLKSRVITLPRALWIRVLVQYSILPTVASRHDVLYAQANATGWYARRPIVVTIQNPNVIGKGSRRTVNRGVHGRANSLLCRLTMRSARNVVVISEYIRDEIVSDGIDPHKVTVVHSGMEEFLGTPDRPGALRSDRFVLVLASDASHKRLELVADAFARAAVADDVTLVIAGSVTQERMTELHDRAAPGRVEFLGFVSSRREVQWLLANAIALVSASEHEAFPLPLVEAAATGCPMILSDIGPHREIARMGTVFFRMGDADQLALLIRSEVERPSHRQPWSWPVRWSDHSDRLATVLRNAHKARLK